MNEPAVSDMIRAFPAGSGQVGLDLEADSLYCYEERICLMQVCYGEKVVLVDPLGDEDLSPLVDWLRTAEIWMHGADYDMSLMLKAYDFVPPVLFDTQIAAQLVGCEKFGYASLVEQFFGVELSKSSQKANWGQRPLSQKMMDYARNDVRYLLPLAEKLSNQLREKGRFDWFVESCAATREKVILRERQEKETWRVNGSGRLSSRGLAFLEALWSWRDGEAKEWNKPAFMVATNKNLVLWADQLSKGKTISPPERMRSSRWKRQLPFLKRAQDLAEIDLPKRVKSARSRKDQDFESKLQKQLNNRNTKAKTLGIDPSLLGSRSVWEQIVAGRGAPEELLMRWQREQLGV